MIVYFADRKMNILGKASTSLPNGIVIINDTKTEDIETGVAVFEFTLGCDAENFQKCKEYAAVGNYILRKRDNENEFYTIIDTEIDTKHMEISIYAEDAGLDLLNEVVGAYEADKAYSIEYYINKFAYDSGFVIGVNEAAGLTRKLSWDGDSTVTERIASIATQFDGCEVSYSFDIKGLAITKKYINIYKQRGKDIGIQLRLNKEIDRIITKQSIENLATALLCTGGTPEDTEEPITLNGYKYDDGNFYVDGSYLKSRNALKKWSRYIWVNEPDKTSDEGHIVRTYSYDTTSQSELCNRAITELKKISEIEVNYEVDITKLPDNTKIGDRVNIIDDAGELYVSARILSLETSDTRQENVATLGEYLIKGSQINQKVAELAEQFSKMSVTAQRAKEIANTAKSTADAAHTTAYNALIDAQAAQAAAYAAQTAADNAQTSAENATTAANNAQAAVSNVEKDMESLNTSVSNAQAAAEQAQQAAETATTKATEAHTAATQAASDASEAKTAAGNAQTAADAAQAGATAAQSTADTAKTKAEEAATTAAAAKADAANAQKEIDALGENLTTLESTMTADYARKTDLTEATASLQTQITQNASEISSTAKKVQTIDETANNAASTAAQAQTAAQAAQEQADQATADAVAAQTAANNAATAAANAQSEADKAKTAAATAQSVADKAQTDLEAAQADLATVTSRVDATEEDIATAQAAVTAAQSAADKAKADAAAAAQTATEAQTKADTAATNAANAQEVANDANSKATIAQTAANEAKATAQNAVSTANTAKENATAAQTAADKAKADALAAQTAADAADAKAQQAATDLAKAQKNLSDVTSRVDATEEEVAAAQAAVVTAQAAADKAKEDAAAAQSTADTAKANATKAQTAADNAKTAAEAAQAAAEQAQAAADAAQADVDALAVRVTTAETSITQNSEQIALRAKKTEVESYINAIRIGGRNLIKRCTETDETWIDSSGNVVTHSSHSTSDYISVTPGSDYMFTKKESELYPGNTAYFRYAWYDSEQTYIGRAANSSKEFLWTAPSGAYYVRISYPIDCYPKFEKGNKATDWTPAPEDVEQDILDTEDRINETITNKETAIISTSETIILEALKSYVETTDYEKFKEEVNSALKLTSEELKLKFSQSISEINKVNDDLQSKFNKITKYFTFDINGLVIGQVDNPYKVIIDNDHYSMTVNEIEVLWFDGTGKGYIPELTITKLFNLFDYSIAQDEHGNVNFEYAGGE